MSSLMDDRDVAWSKQHLGMSVMKGSFPKAMLEVNADLEPIVIETHHRATEKNPFFTVAECDDLSIGTDGTCEQR